MIIFRNYDENAKIDRVWYKSSNIVYSECYDNENALKDLMVVFSNGTSYMYHGVDVNDYVMFVHGGIDGSNGRALNKFIKQKKCEYEKLGTVDLTDLQKKLEQARAEAAAKKAVEANNEE